MIAPAAPMHDPVLPSGRFAVSNASNGIRTLALDEQGNLFLTDNGGRTWQTLARSWSGSKAIVVTFTGAPKEAIAGAQHGSGRARGRFELRTDTGDLWFSFDGTHWTKKAP